MNLHTILDLTDAGCRLREFRNKRTKFAIMSVCSLDSDEILNIFAKCV
jgi:hypothetical protein